MQGLMTELEAVNKILAVAGDSPVSTLDDNYSQMSLARSVLSRVSRDVQSIGWWFNEEQEVSLSPDMAGQITLASNVIEVSPIEDKGDYIQRGNRLYNRTDRTYIFTEPVLVDQVLALDWNELPQKARVAIVDMACIEFNNEFIGAQEVKAQLALNAQRSWDELRSADSDGADINLLRKTRINNIAFRNRR